MFPWAFSVVILNDKENPEFYLNFLKWLKKKNYLSVSKFLTDINVEIWK